MHMLVFALLIEYHAIPCRPTPCFPCADPGFSSGGSGTIIFQGSRGGPTFSRGGPTFSRGSNCLYPIEPHITCDFPGGSGPPDAPLDPHLLSRPAGDSFFPFSRLWVVFFSLFKF